MKRKRHSPEQIIRKERGRNNFPIYPTAGMAR